MHELFSDVADEPAWYRHIVERAVAGIVVVQDERFIYVNPAAARMFGRNAEDLIGHCFNDFLCDGARARHREAAAALASGTQASTYNEYDVMLPTGVTRQFAVTGALIQWRGCPALLGVAHDISMQRCMTDALRASEERYRSMVVALDEGVLIFDAKGVVQGANPAAERLLKREFAELRRTNLADWVAVGLDGQPLAVQELPLAQTLATGEPRRHVLLGDRACNGDIVWLDVNVEALRDEFNTVTGAVVSFTDITQSRRTQEALRISESTNRTLMDALADGVFVAQDERFVYANVTLPRLLGYSREEFIGMPFGRVVVPEMLSIWLTRYRARIGSGNEPINSYEVRFICKDGSAIDLELVANRTQFLERPAVLGVLRDITERKLAAAELERHRHRLEELVHERTCELEQAVAARIASENFAQTMTDNQPTLLAYLDRELRVQFANRAFLSWFGITREESLGRDVRETIGNFLIEASQEVLARVFGGEAMGVASDMHGGDGRLGHFWIYRMPDVRDGHFQGYFFIATDITEIRHGQHRLQELNAALVHAEAFTRNIADNLPGRVVYWDRGGYCRFANKVYCEGVGKTHDQVLGKSEFELFGVFTDPELRRRAQAAMTGEPQLFEIDEISADGSHATSLVHYIPDRHEGQVRGYFVLTSDITQLKRSQDNLKRLNDELVIARDRSEAAGRAKASFLANMSHEIRTPMNVIIGLTHLMRRDRHDDITRDRLGKVSDAAQHLLDIINDILDLSKIDAGKLTLELTDFSVEALLARSNSLIADTARRKGLTLSLVISELPAMLRGDALRLSQILVNLLSNAVKFTATGGIELHCRVADRAGPRCVLLFSVKDTGIGIDKNRIEQLFNPFEQADGSTTRRYGGTGLGLSIARELSTLMGGEIGVESEPGVGSTFWFTACLECAMPNHGLAAAPLLSAMPDGDSVESLLKARHAGARILLTEDNLVNQELATLLLQLVGLEVDIAENGYVAVEKSAHETYHLILMDMQMPDMDGLEATRFIRANPALANIPIIAMTANAFGSDRMACLAAGMNDHIGKPVHPIVLYDTLLRWLDLARVGGVTPPAPSAIS